MKKNIKKVSLMVAMSASLMMMAACGTETNEPENTPVATETQNVENPGSTDTMDYSSYPEDFNEWKMVDLKNYLTAAGITTNEEFISMDMSDNDLTPMNATAGYVYADVQAGSVADTICFFDSNDADAKAMLDSIIENQAIVIDGNIENGIPMDAVLGGFAFSYGNGTDEEHIGAFVQALKNLEAHYGVQAAYINE